MIDTQKLVAYISAAPFPEAEKERLITLACVADEEHKQHIYLLVKKFTEKQAQEIQENARNFKRFIRKTGEEILHHGDEKILQKMEATLSTL